MVTSYDVRGGSVPAGRILRCRNGANGTGIIKCVDLGRKSLSSVSRFLVSSAYSAHAPDSPCGIIPFAQSRLRILPSLAALSHSLSHDYTSHPPLRHYPIRSAVTTTPLILPCGIIPFAQQF